MINKNDLKNKLKQIDNNSYKKYKTIQGTYDFREYILILDYIQGDPFASPSRARLKMSMDEAKIPEKYYDTKEKKIALEDFLARSFNKEIKYNVKGRRGTGKSGIIDIDYGKQEIIERTAVEVNKNFIEVRFIMGLPAKGRRILGIQAIKMIFDELPIIANNSLKFDKFDKSLMIEFVNIVTDQIYLRKEIKKKNIVAFIANDSILPRESGISDRPMKGKNVIPFKSPKSMEVEFYLPNKGHIKGMGIKKGINLIVGGGYHGKSTILNAIEKGVYNHIPGDGREYVVTDSSAVKIRAEDGRRVENVNITPFISNLPNSISTENFSTENASGSTSQASNIMEAIEVGTNLLLLDEDTSATNFMIRDGRMQALVSKDKEPITPFIDRVKDMYETLDISTIIVMGGSGDYFDVCNNVILMEDYIPKDVTEEAKKISREFKTIRNPENVEKFQSTISRKPIKKSLNVKGKLKIKVRGVNRIQYGKSNIDLSYVEQLVDDSQTRAISQIIRYMYKNHMDNKTTLKELVDIVSNDIDKEGLQIISQFRNKPPGDLALPRKYEIASALNRLRTMTIK